MIVVSKTPASISIKVRDPREEMTKWFSRSRAGALQLDAPVDSIDADDTPTFGITSSNANDRGMVIGVAKLVTCMIAVVFITE